MVLKNKINIDINLLRRVADVARLKLSDEELQKLLPDFKDIIEVFSKIDEVESDESFSYLPIEIKNVFREDDVKDSLSVEEALSNSVHKQDNYFKGPKIV